MSNVIQTQVITGCSGRCRRTTHKLIHAHAEKVTHKDTGEHSHPHSHHCLWKRILKVCFTKLGRGGRIFSFSPSSGRCVFQREGERASSAGQVISLSQWESTPWNSPREAREAAFIIFLLYYCQNLLCFTFCCWWPPFFLHNPIAFILSPSHLYVEVFRVLFFPLSVHRYTLFTDSCASESESVWKGSAPDVEFPCRSNATGCWCNQMPAFIFFSGSAFHIHPLSWDGNMPMATLTEQIWLQTWNSFEKQLLCGN